MAKTLPADALIMLHNRLSNLRARDPERRLIIKEAAVFYGISESSLYRGLGKHNRLKIVHRKDYNNPRIIDQSEMKLYCEIIAALKIRTSNKKGRHLSTKECIRLLENSGVETPNGLIKAPVGLLKKTTISRYLNRFGLGRVALSIQPTVVHFQAENSNDCWHFDFSYSDFKYFQEDNFNDKSGRPVLMLASVVDDRSGATYQEYHYVYGEDIMTALKFLFNAMAPKKNVDTPFQGIPRVLYLDNGPVAKSNVFKRVMDYLNIEVRTHMPEGRDGRRKTARSKGKVERPFRTIKETLEPLYHIHPPSNLAEANEWLKQYLQRYNQGKHRYEEHTRLDDWKKHLPPEGFQAMCDWEKFSLLAREPETRQVGSDACVSVNGTKYQLSGEFAGLTVTLLWGIFDNELRIEFDGKHFGPFYPSEGPISFGKYRPFKKNTREKRADVIECLAKKISIPRSALSGADNTTAHIIDVANLIEEHQPSVPFTLGNPFEQTMFKDSVEARTAISRWLGYPLSKLNSIQLAKINIFIEETLDKQILMAKIKRMFELRIINNY